MNNLSMMNNYEQIVHNLSTKRVYCSIRFLQTVDYELHQLFIIVLYEQIVHNLPIKRFYCSNHFLETMENVMY